MHEKSLTEKLVSMVSARKGKLTFADDCTCINVSLPNGSFIATSYENTLEWNLRACIDFVNRCHVGTCYPVKRPAISNLGEIAGVIAKLHKDHAECDEMSHLMGGEFAPDMTELYEEEIEAALAGFGLTVDQYNAELANRIRMNYTYHCTLRA